MTRRDKDQPKGISDAAVKGAREGESKEQPARDSKTVDPDQAGNVSSAPSGRTTEDNEAPMGGAPVAFPAPSAQPVRQKETEQPAKVDTSWPEDEDEKAEWRRAGGGDAPKK